MNTLPAIARSGMSAARTSLGASAHNIANLGTPDFRRQGVSRAELASGGVTARVERATTPGHAPEADVVAQLSARNEFLANLAVFRASDAMTGTLLSLRA